ncbi:hypothetical protein ACFWRV_13455 [Streptomyces sp. NPDC058576]|uniref:hypothetical protein n=1 Tax=Streptomyces sp. NPDC058576 TaxID=3346547 RepID=UPI00364C194F
MHDPTPAPAGADGHEDVLWRPQARAAVGIGTAFFVAALLVDAVGPGVTMIRTAGWGCLAAVLLVVLFPPRISLAPGRLVVRGLFTTKVVLTDRLSALQWPADVSERVILTDVRGTQAPLDFCLLRANPSLWLRLEADARESRRCGSLVRGTACFDRLVRRMDEEAARSVFRSSGID